MNIVVRPLGPWLGPRTPYPRPARFRTGYTDTIALLTFEVDKLGGDLIVLQIDVSEKWVRRDGQLHASAQPTSQALRISFDSRHGPLTYATDEFDRWQDNLRAIALSLEALRAVDRYGVSRAGEQYRGWQAIDSRPAEMTPQMAAEFIAEWTDDNRFLASDILRDPHVRNRAMKVAGARTHPDRTGDRDTFARLTRARAILDELDAM